MEQVHEVTIAIPRIDGGISNLVMKAGATCFVLGRNGTGKSGLVHFLRRHFGSNGVYLPGSRPNYLENEGLNMTHAARRNYFANEASWDQDINVRWRPPNGTMRNEALVAGLQSAIVQALAGTALNIADGLGSESDLLARLRSQQTPLHRLRAVFSQAGLPVNFLLDDAQLMAQQGGVVYSISKMSDGERAALFLAAAILCAAPSTIILLDEPELHLHASISVPLIRSLVQERPDCSFVIATHELDLPAAIEESKVLLVRSGNPEAQQWDLDIIDSMDSIPEDVRTDILGSRRKVLFIEGEATSLDVPMYTLLFPEVAIRPKSGCREVTKAVNGLRDTENLHRTRAFGLIDQDGASTSKIESNEKAGLFSLPFYSIEGLYYCQEVVTALAEQQAGTYGVSPKSLIDEAVSKAFGEASKDEVRTRMAKRIAEQQLREHVTAKIPTWSDISGEPVKIEIPSPLPDEIQRAEQIVADGDLFAFVARYPIRETGIRRAISQGLRFPTYTDYEIAVLAQVSTNPDLRERLRAKFSSLTHALSS